MGSRLGKLKLDLKARTEFLLSPLAKNHRVLTIKMENSGFHRPVPQGKRKNQRLIEFSK